jgi:hypothetical protein
VWFRRGRLLIVSPDSLGTACPLSGRNSTYRLVQILEAGSVSAPDKGASSVVTLTAALLAMPTFWFGGPWLTTKLLEPVQVQDLINPYVGSLAVTFSIISLYPAARWIIQLGEDFGKRRGE